MMEAAALSQQCSSCDASSARCWCVDCAEALCDACVSAHRRVTLTRSHQILNQPDNQPGEVSTPPTKFCRLHPSEPFKLYCFTCSKLTCRDCQLTSHMNHRYQFISEALVSLKQQMMVCVAPVAASRETMRRSLQDMESRLQDIAECESHLKFNLQRSYSILTQHLNQRMEDLLQQVKSVSQSECEQLQLRVKKTKELLQSQQVVTEIAEKAKNTNDLCTLQTYTDQMASLLKVLPDQDPSPPQTMCQLKVVTDRSSLEAVLNCGHLEVKWIPFSVSKTSDQNSPAASNTPPSTSTCPAPTSGPLPLTENSCSAPTPPDNLFTALQRTVSTLLSPSNSSSSTVSPTPPTRPAPTRPAPTCPAPTCPAPTRPTPTHPAPTCPAPTRPTPTGPAPTRPAPSRGILPHVGNTSDTCSPVPVRPASMLKSMLTCTPPPQPDPRPQSDVTTAAAATKAQTVQHPSSNNQSQVLMLINPVQPVSTSASLQPVNFHGLPSAGPTAPQGQNATVLLTNTPLSCFSLPSVVPQLSMLLSQPSAGNTSLNALKSLKVRFVPGQFSKALDDLPAAARGSQASTWPRQAALQGQTQEPKNRPVTDIHSTTTSSPQASTQSLAPDVSPQCSSQQSPVVRAVADSACSHVVQQVAVRQQEPAENEPTSTVSEEPASSLQASGREEEEHDTKNSGTEEEKPEAKPLDREEEEPEASGRQDEEPEIRELKREDKDPETKYLDGEDKEPSPPQPEMKVLKREDDGPEMEDWEREDKEYKTGTLDRENTELQTKVSDREDEDPETEDSEREDEHKTGISDRENKKLQLKVSDRKDEDPETEDSEREDEEPSPPKAKLQVLKREDEDPETEDSEMEYEERKTYISDREPETEDSEKENEEPEREDSETEATEPSDMSDIGRPGFSLSQWQPKVSLFRLPLSGPDAGRPHPGFRLVTGDAEDEIYLEEMSEDAQSRADDSADGISLPSPGSPVTHHREVLLVNCSACQSASASIICTTCGRGYHRHCHLPSVQPDEWSDWMCALCQDLSDPSDASDRPPARRSPGLSLLDQRRCESLLLQLKVEGCSLLPESGLNWLSERLIGRPARYQSAAEFLSDVWSLFSDASQDDGALMRLKERVRRRWMRTSERPRPARRPKGSKVTAEEQEAYVSKLRETRKRLRDTLRETPRRKKSRAGRDGP